MKIGRKYSSTAASSILIYKNSKQSIYTQMRWRDATLINRQLKAKMESLSLNEVMKCNCELLLQILRLIPKLDVRRGDGR